MIINDILLGLIIISFFGAFISVFLRIVISYIMIWHFRKDILKNPFNTLKNIFINADNVLDERAKKYQNYIDLFSRYVVYFLCISFSILIIMIITSFFF